MVFLRDYFAFECCSTNLLPCLHLDSGAEPEIPSKSKIFVKKVTLVQNHTVAQTATVAHTVHEHPVDSPVESRAESSEVDKKTRGQTSDGSAGARPPDVGKVRPATTDATARSTGPATKVVLHRKVRCVRFQL